MEPARTLWEALVLGEKWNNTWPGLRLATTACEKLHFGGKVLFCLDPALVLAQKPSRHLPTAPDSVPTCWPRITRDRMDVYDLKFLTNNNEYIIGICVSVSISGSQAEIQPNCWLDQGPSMRPVVVPYSGEPLHMEKPVPLSEYPMPTRPRLHLGLQLH